MPSATFSTEATREAWASETIGRRSRRAGSWTRAPSLIGKTSLFLISGRTLALGPCQQVRTARDSFGRVRAHGARELREEPPGRRIFPQVLRMPLDREEPRPRGLERLDQAVRGQGGDFHTRREPLDRLVMPAVDVDLGRPR